MSEYLEKIVYLSQADYNTLLNGGSITRNGITLDSLEDNYLYITDGTISSTDISGVIPISKGGTNASTVSDARLNLGLGDAATKSVVTSISTSTNLPTSTAVKTYVDNSVATRIPTTGTAGDILYWSAADTPAHLVKGSNGKVLKLANGLPTWGDAGTVTSVRVQASSPLQSSTSTAQSSSLDTTISFTNQNANVVLAGPSSGSSAAAPTFRALVAADIPSLDWSKIGSGKPTTLSGYGITDAAASGHTQAVNKGGTNITSYTIGDILYASAATTLSKLTGNTTTTVKYLKSVATTSGTAVAPAWAQIAASEISGLGAAATKAVTDNSSNADVTSTDTNLITGRTLYYQLAKKGYTTNTGTVTSVTLTQGAGITVSDSGTAITGSGSRTISITGMNTSSGSTSKCLTEKGTWASFTNNAGTVTSVQVQASGPLSSSTSTAQSSTLSTTISFSNQDPNKVLAGPSSGSSAGAPSFRALVAADIPGLPWSKITSGTPTTLSGYGITDGVSSSALSGYVAKSGDTMTGVLIANNFVSKYGVEFQNSSGTNVGGIFQDMEGANQFYMDEYTTGGVRECYLLPVPNATATSFYDILTSKNAVTIAQGGTGATDAATARTNLGLGSMATANTSDYLPLSGGTMTGAITLNNGVAMNTASEAGWSMNQYGNLTHRRTNDNDYLGIVGSNGDAIRFYYDTGEAKANTMTCTTSKPQCIEISGMSSSAGHGGFIDFHFNNSSADYTSRIIESASGVLYANGVKLDNNCVTVPGGNVYIDRSDSPYIHLRNSSAQEIGGLWASVSAKRVYIRVRPSAGSGNATDIIFPAAASSNANYYVYTSANFSLSGTTLTITPPS